MDTDQKHDGGSAFPVAAPVNSPVIHFGMTLRDVFAAQAMLGLMFRPGSDGRYEDVLSESAYVIADAMIKARKKGQP